MTSRLRKLDALGPKFMSRFVVDESGCWLWTSYKDSRGYGSFWIKPRCIRAYKLAYEAVNGPVPDGLELDHICRVPACINPDHLRAVTHRENVLAGNAPSALSARKTHCQAGHELAGDNLIATTVKRRNCKVCHRRRALEYYYRQRATA